MAGTLRLSNTGTGNGQSTITTAASGDTTYTLPSGGGTFVTTGSTQALTVAFASGTVSAPSITFLGDSNTGIYSPAADTIAFTEGGVEALRIDSSGRVGIGTSSPNSALDVNGVITIRNSGTVRGLIGAVAGDSNYVGLQNGSLADSFANSAINQNTTGTTTVNSASGQSLSLRIGNGTALHIDSSRNVGIGTTSPDRTLHVNGAARTQNLSVYGTAGGNAVQVTAHTDNVARFRILNNAESAQLTALSTDGTNTALESSGQIIFSPSNTERARIDSFGRLLVGTSSGASNSAILQTRSDNTNAYNGGNFYSANNGAGPRVEFCKSRGSAASPSLVSEQDELGSIFFCAFDGAIYRNSAIIQAFVDQTPGASDVPSRLVFSTTADGASSPTERMRIANDGKIGFGTTTLTGKFNFDGSVFLFSQPSGAGNSTLKFNTSTGAVTYDTSSRLVKQNIEDCPYGLAELAQLKPRKYFRTDDQKVEIGFVADEVADVLPEFVPIGPKYIITKNEADTEEIPLGVNYEKLTAVLTKALQETAGEIELLKARIAALESA